MKQIILLVFITILSVTLSAQPFSNYIDHTSQWGMVSGGVDGINNYVSHYRYEIHGDTTIGSNDYFKLFRVGVDSVIHVMFPGPADVNFDSSYAGALREDPAGMLYFIYTGQTTEYLLYQFNLLPGESLSNMQGNYGCNTPQLIVVNYDTVYLGATPLKRFSVNNSLVARIIEGVGSEKGLIEQGCMCTAIESGSTLICYKKGNDILQVNPAMSCELPPGFADTTITTDTLILRNHQFNIYPNPAYDKIRVDAGDAHELREIKITNATGQVVLFVHGLQQTYIDLDIRQLSRGVFFLSVKTDKEIIARIFMKR